MRINIEVPLPLRSDQKSNATSSIPPALIKLSPSGELVLIELQGSLEIDDANAEGGQALGKLEFNEGLEDRPTLLISHHRLEGKIVSLTKPFAVLEKKRRSNRREEENKSSTLVLPPSSPLVSSRAVINASQLLDELDGDEPASPSMSRKRARVEIGKVIPHTPVKGLDRVSTIIDSSPMPSAPLRGSELDFSSPMPMKRQVNTSTVDEEGGEEEQDWLQKKSTSTYFQVVCIIRRKILFTKRPEPVVRLDGEGGEAARKALGLVEAT